jgi:dienelactone hydrolase
MADGQLSVSFQVDLSHRRQFEHGGFARDVFSDGTGPGVLILHELPGLSPACLSLGARVRDAGFHVELPLLFGQPGDHHVGAAAGIEIARLCLRNEFHLLATDKNAPITDWLRALCRDVYTRTQHAGRGIGVIGMCLTGNVVLSLMLEEQVLVPVTCEPSLPFEVPHTPGAEARRVSPGVTDEDFVAAGRRAQTVPLLGYRFKTDALCRAERFDAIQAQFGQGFLRRDIPTGPDHPGNVPADAHSVLTEYFVDDPAHPTRQALDEILDRFSSQLKQPNSN